MQDYRRVRRTSLRVSEHVTIVLELSLFAYNRISGMVWPALTMDEQGAETTL